MVVSKDCFSSGQGFLKQRKSVRASAFQEQSQGKAVERHERTEVVVSMNSLPPLLTLLDEGQRAVVLASVVKEHGEIVER